MGERTLILSDLHLGAVSRSARSAAALRPLWQGFNRLIVNGDVAEIHHHRAWTFAIRELRDLLDSCRADGVDVSLICGNHDAFISEHRHLFLADGEVLVTHGDAIHPLISPWSSSRPYLRRAYESAMARLGEARRDDLVAFLYEMQLAAHGEWNELRKPGRETTVGRLATQPWLVCALGNYWLTQHRLAERFLQRFAPQSRFILYGHSHRPGVKRVNGRIAINTGGFGFPWYPLAVSVDDGSLAVWRIDDDGTQYLLRNRPEAVFDLGR